MMIYYRSIVTDEEAIWLQWAEKQFIAIAGEDQQIDLDEFKTALQVKKASLNLHKQIKKK